jgi:hypothetical protein
MKRRVQMADGENTSDKHRGLLPPWQPGQSGNPLGRPKGSRNKLGEEFVAALHDDFTVHGKDAIEKVRADHPDQYLKVIASILPKELHVKDASLGDMTDDELIELLAAVRSFTATDRGEKTSRRAKKAPGEEGAVPPGRVN